jgi:hypothetical protein
MTGVARSVGLPIFVGGCSRSGTTLLGAMLGWGEGRLTVPEADFKWEMYASCAVDQDRVDLPLARALLAGDPKFALWGIAPAPGHGSMHFGELMSSLVERHAAARGTSARVAWIDHTPGNIRFVPTWHRVLPEARFVHVIRDGRAVAASVLPLDWGPNTATEAARHWALQVVAGLAAAEALGPDLVHTVRYEDLVLEPERTLKLVCDFAGIDYDDRMVDKRDYALPAYTAGQHDLVLSRPDPGRVEAWRDVLRPAQVRAFERLTGELLDLLGYRSDYGISAARQGPAEHYRELAGSAVRRVVLDRLRRRSRWRRGR